MLVLDPNLYPNAQHSVQTYNDRKNLLLNFINNSQIVFMNTLAQYATCVDKLRQIYQAIHLINVAQNDCNSFNNEKQDLILLGNNLLQLPQNIVPQPLQKLIALLNQLPNLQPLNFAPPPAPVPPPAPIPVNDPNGGNLTTLDYVSYGLMGAGFFAAGAGGMIGLGAKNVAEQAANKAVTELAKEAAKSGKVLGEAVIKKVFEETTKKVIYEEAGRAAGYVLGGAAAAGVGKKLKN